MFLIALIYFILLLKIKKKKNHKHFCNLNKIGLNVIDKLVGSSEEIKSKIILFSISTKLYKKEHT